MKYAFALAAVAGLASASAHVGHGHLHRRDAMHTVTDWTVVTVTDVVTVFGPSPTEAQHAPSSAAPVVAPASSAAAPSSKPAAPPAPPASSPVEQHTTLQTKTSEAPKAPAPSSKSDTPVPKPAAPATSSPVAAAPPASTAAAPSSAAAVPSTGASTGGSSSANGNLGMQAGASVAANCDKGTPCDGDMTTYTPGIGSCGYDDASGEHADNVVALQSNMFGSLSNSGMNEPSNKLCNKAITIINKATGATAQGVIRDKCPGCTGPGGIDLAPALFAKLNAGADTGRFPVEWYFS